MKKVLILWSDKNGDFPSIIEEYYGELVDCENLFYPINKVMRGIRKAVSGNELLIGFFVDKWIERISSYESVIVPASMISRKIPQLLRRKGYPGKIIFWYWNPVIDCVDPMLINRDACDLWSFDRNDCERYDMKFNTQYFFRRYTEHAEESTGKISDSSIVDFYFVGKDKNRYQKIKKLQKSLESKGYITKFEIIRDSTSAPDGYYSSRIPYEENLRNTRKTRCVVELMQEGQSGLTLRTLEALFYNKKLLTDNTGLDRENELSKGFIYYLDGGLDELDSFMKEEVEKEENSIEYYDFETWLRRFDG